MKLSVLKPSTSESISSIEFNDNVIVEEVTFWTNVKYQSPQFPLDLTPNVNQLGSLYEDGNIPEFSGETCFEVTSEGNEKITNLRIVQLKMHFLDSLETIPTLDIWGQYFITETDPLNHWCVVPDGSVYITSNVEGATIVIEANPEPTNILYLSYEVLVAFKIEDITYYASFDPYAKVTSSKT